MSMAGVKDFDLNIFASFSRVCHIKKRTFRFISNYLYIYFKINQSPIETI